MRRCFLPSILALALAGLLAGPGQGATAPLTFTVALVQEATYRHPHPPDGDPGDTFSTTQKLSAVGTVLGVPNGRRIGTMQFTWGPLDGACSTNAAGCNGTTTIRTLTQLPGGTITANGIKVSLSHGIVLPVEGGTGIFRGVTGKVYVAPGGEDVEVFRLKLP
jgi:hypothetical protein